MGKVSLDVVAVSRRTDPISKVTDGPATRRRLTPNLFGVPFGLAGLAEAWATAATLGSAPAAVGDALWIGAATALVILTPIYLHNVIFGGRLMTELHDPIFAPFLSLPPILTMLFGVALAEHARAPGVIIFVAGLAVTVLLGGWLVGQWILSDLTLGQLHPGYFLPTVAGGYLACSSSAALGYDSLARIMFGYATVSWLLLGSILLTRLFTAPLLPAPLLPTMAIQVAPPVVAGTAWFAINGGRVDTVALGLAGYAALMVLVQGPLASAYRRAPFGPGWWSFAFSYAAVFVDALHWLHAEHASHATAWSGVLLAVPSLAIALLVTRTAAATAQGTFLPATPSTTTGSQP
jgi:tellurite resistance protein